jgi:hypothetical protein
VRKILGRLLVLGAAAGAAYALRGYLLRGSTGSKKGDVQIVLDNGATIEPGPVEAQEFADIARKVLEIDGQAR